MAKVTFLSCYAIVCFFVGQAICAVYDPNVKSIDIFQIHQINGYQLENAMDSLNDILIERTESPDLETNLEIILDELISDFKSKIDSTSKLTEAKRLLASLSNLEGNLCNSYGYSIIHQCVESLGFSKIVKALKNEPSRRVDKILVPVIKSRIFECRQVYFDKFAEISSESNDGEMERVDKFLDGAIKKIVPVVEGENYAIKLFNAAQERTSGKFYLDPTYTYNALKDLAAKDVDAIFLEPVEDQSTGLRNLRRDKFDRLFYDYIKKPCKYFTNKLGTNVFEEVTLDSKFYHKVQEDRIDFYKAWVKYRFCLLDTPALKEVVDYVRYINKYV